jgi:hypothetical protein
VLISALLFALPTGVVLSEALGTDEGTTLWGVISAVTVVVVIKRATLSSVEAAGATALALVAATFLMVALTLLWVIPRG